MQIVGTINATVKMNGKLYLGGSFTSINGQPYNNFAEIDLSTGNPTSYRPIFDSAINKMEACGNKIVIAGTFKNINGQSNYILAILDQPSLIIDSAFTTLQITDNIQSQINEVKYHQNSGYVFVGGTLSFTQGGSQRKGMFIFNPNTFQVLPVSNIVQSDIYQSFDIDQVNNIIFYVKFVFGNGATIGSLNLSNINSIAYGSWFPNITSSSGSFGRIFYANGRVFLSSSLSTLSYGANVFRGLISTFANGFLDILRWDVVSNAFFGASNVSKIFYQNGNYYIIGSWTNLFDGSQRPSFFVRDAVGNKFKGDNINFIGWQTITYINNAKIPSFSPSYITEAVFDDNYLHFFGALPVVDGVMQNNGHYILNFDGTRIQKAFAVLL